MNDRECNAALSGFSLETPNTTGSRRHIWNPPYQHACFYFLPFQFSVLLSYFLPERTTRKSNKMTKNTREHLDDIAGALQELEEVFGDTPLEDEEENSQTQGPDSIEA